ncbi:hypothetical protein MKK70_24520, partial [Methylobacterium sp. E-041]|uniref:hypothetical protein n=1 Tax=Methylobacterium sp. E-041 TaxID=2836573 RepID=UPI001FBBE837
MNAVNLLAPLALLAITQACAAQGMAHQQPTQQIAPGGAAGSDTPRKHVDRQKERQDAFDRESDRKWRHWDYAVCIGCSAHEGRVRHVVTNPLRVLAG